jgi:hypothetical protein
MLPEIVPSRGIFVFKIYIKNFASPSTREVIGVLKWARSYSFTLVSPNVSGPLWNPNAFSVLLYIMYAVQYGTLLHFVRQKISTFLFLVSAHTTKL